jgi:hypothetical protein
MAEVAPVRPASPVEAIIVSFEDEAKAGIAAPRVASPTVSDLLRAIPDTSKVAPSSRAVHAEEASSLGPPWRIFGGTVLSDETIIEPSNIGACSDLVRSRPDPLIWGGPPLAWTSTEGDL